MMIDAPDDLDELMKLAIAGDGPALGALFERHRGRLEVMLRLRMDRRLQGRLDPADVLQEAYLDVARRFPEYLAAEDPLPFYLWVRLLTGQKLAELHRRHLGAKMRNAGLEVTLYRGSMPRASSASLAGLLMGRLTTASRVAMRGETQLRVQAALNKMEPIDREVLVLRHFELMNNEETARALGIKPSAASNRHIRPLKRLEEVLAEDAGFVEQSHPLERLHHSRCRRDDRPLCQQGHRISRESGLHDESSLSERRLFRFRARPVGSPGRRIPGTISPRRAARDQPNTLPTLPRVGRSSCDKLLPGRSS